MKRILFFIIFLQTLSLHADFRFRIAEDRGTLDWGYGEVNQDIVLQIMRGLTETDENGKIIPAIAKSWKYLNSKKLIFTLDEKARWSDGKQICAQDFVNAWKRVLSIELASPYAQLLFDIKNAKWRLTNKTESKQFGAKANSCTELEVNFENASPFFAALTSHWVLFPVRNDLIEKYKNDWLKPENLVVTGAYLVKKWSRDSEMILERNENDWLKKAHEKTLVAKVVPDDKTALDLFQTGNLDWIRDLPFYEKESLSKLPEYRIDNTLVNYFIGFKIDKSSKITKVLRCEMSRSLQKSDIAKFLRGGEVQLNSFLEMFKNIKSPTAEAKLNKFEGQSVVLDYYSKDIHVPLAQWLQDQWHTKLGLNVELRMNEGKAYWKKLQSNVPDIFLSGITAAFAHPYAILSEFDSHSKSNYGGYKSKIYDDQIRSESESDWVSAEKKLIAEECAVIPLYQRQTSSLISKKWTGFKMNPLARVNLSKVKQVPNINSSSAN